MAVLGVELPFELQPGVPILEQPVAPGAIFRIVLRPARAAPHIGIYMGRASLLEPAPGVRPDRGAL